MEAAQQEEKGKWHIQVIDAAKAIQDYITHLNTKIEFCSKTSKDYYSGHNVHGRLL